MAMAVSPDYLRQLMIDRGFPQHIAEGFLMNFGDESGFNPGINEIAPTVPGSRGGYGLYQITGTRRRAYEAQAVKRGAAFYNPVAQIDFMVQELQGPERRAAASIFATKSPQEAAIAIVRDFLRPAPENLQKRIAKYGGASSSVSTGATNGAMPMGLLNMPQEPQSFGDRIKAGFQSGEMFDKLAMAFNSLRLNPDEGLGQMIQAKQSRKDEDQKTNRTAAWLEASGRPDLAQAVASGALGGREAVGLFYQPKEDTRLQELQIQKAEFELGQLQAGIGQDPDVQASQALPDQSGVVMTMRDGSVRVKTVGGDTLEGQAALDFVRKSQETNAEYQRSIYGAREEGKLGAQISQGEDAAAAGARGTEIGKAQGAAIVGAPGEVAGADMTIEYIGELRNHPGLDIGTGATSLGNSIPGTPGYDFQNRLNQLLSGGFLTAIDQLRGMGALSNAEGQTATRAISRMDAATSKEEFLAALADYERIVKAGRERAAARMNGRTEPQDGQGAAPTAGTVRKKFNPQTGAFE